MAYAVVYWDSAQADLEKLDAPTASFILDEVERLAQAPVENSKRRNVTFRPQQQRFEFWNPDHDSFILVFFLYGQDEQTIEVTDIGVVRY